jgi:hypothetical protein
MDDQGFQEAEYRITMAWSKERINELADMINLAKKTQGEAWPESLLPNAFFSLEPFFRDGDNAAHNTKNREYLKGTYYMNFKSKAIASRNPVTGQVVYSGAPGVIGPRNEDIMPLDIYSGCTGRCSGIMFGADYLGKHFISVRLNNIQLFEAGERIGGVRPAAKDQFTPLIAGTGNTASGLPDIL